MPTFTAREIFKAAFSLYREAMPLLVRRVLPLLAVVQAIDAVDFPRPSALLVLSGAVSWLAMAWANARGLRAVLETRYATPCGNLAFGTFLVFLVLEAYVTLATSVAALFLLIPAFVVMSTTVLAPVFVLEHKHGPFEAVATSTELTKGNLFPITGVVVGFWFVFGVAYIVTAGVASLAGPLARPLDYAVSLALTFIGFFHYAVVVVLLERLHPNPAMHTDLARKAAPGR